MKINYKSYPVLAEYLDKKTQKMFSKTWKAGDPQFDVIEKFKNMFSVDYDTMFINSLVNHGGYPDCYYLTTDIFNIVNNIKAKVSVKDSLEILAKQEHYNVILLLPNKDIYFAFVRVNFDIGSVNYYVGIYNKTYKKISEMGCCELNSFKDATRYERGFYYLDRVHPNVASNIHDTLELLIALKVFLENKHVDVKCINKSRNQNKVKIQGNNIINDKLPIKINVLDSTYFTTIMRLEGFNVSGHFRLQPCGKKKEKKKLIWINDFEKKGYVRQAGKLREGTTNE